MFTKFKVYLCIILCMISLVSVGFSSWTITGLEEESFDVSITADKVINSKEYVYLDTTKGENNSGIDCFKYYEYGYLDSEGYLSNYGYISTYYKLDLKKCYDLLSSDSDSIEINLKLQYSDVVVLGDNYYNLFSGSTSSSGSSSISAICNYTETYTGMPTITVNASSEKSYPCYTVNLTFKDILKNYNKATSPEFICFEVQYALFSTIGDYFYNNIYSFLYSRMLDSSADFKIDIFLSGV